MPAFLVRGKLVKRSCRMVERRQLMVLGLGPIPQAKRVGCLHSYLATVRQLPAKPDAAESSTGSKYCQRMNKVAVHHLPANWMRLGPPM